MALQYENIGAMNSDKDSGSTAFQSFAVVSERSSAKTVREFSCWRPASPASVGANFRTGRDDGLGASGLRDEVSRVLQMQ